MTAHATESIAFDYDLAHSPQKVWRALTDGALLAQWLLPVADLELRPGAEFRFEAPATSDWDGVVTCRFLEIDEPRKLSWSWVAGEIDTVVTFTLTPTAAGTHLRLVQSGFRADQRPERTGARYGWKMMGERLVDLLGVTR